MRAHQHGYIARHESSGGARLRSGGARLRSGGREVVGRRKDGTEVHLFLSPAELPAEAAAGRYIGTLRDITAHKAAEAERKILEDHLRESEKLHAIGRLAGGIAHDFNNLLTVITVSAELLEDGIDAADPLHVDVAQILDASGQAAALARQLLAFSRRELVSRSTVDLVSVIARLEPMLRRLLPENVRLVIDAHGAQPVEADLAQMERLVMNLALNGRDAMPHGGTLTIEARRIAVSEAAAAAAPPLLPGMHVTLVVRDTGVGMNAATLERAFEPFFTTKAVGLGTGLGLSIVYGIVRAASGAIAVGSAPGKGSEFRVWLPLTAATTPEPTPVATIPADATGTILVVEDEPMILHLAARVLKSCGYRVFTASNGEAALAIAATMEGPLSLLFTDVLMPGLGGVELAERILAERSGVKVLLASGYSDEVLHTQGVERERAHFLAKPYSIEVLKRKVREVLGH